MSTPDIQPIKVEEFEVKQSAYSQCGKLPMRAMICAPQVGGKQFYYRIGYLIVIKDVLVEFIYVHHQLKLTTHGNQ